MRPPSELNGIDINTDDIIRLVADKPTPRTGRRPGATRTREAILAAAERQFGARGFDGTTIRSVADEAGVDPALVIQFFGSKDRLFGSSVRWPFDPADEIPAVIGDDPAGVGARLVALFVRTWDTDGGRNPIVALLRAATVREEAGRQLREFLERELLGPILGALDADQPSLRASLVAGQLLGLGAARYVLRFEPLASLPPDRVVALASPALQAALTAPLP
jgi:AcrR family transcriptional regulator